MVKIVCDKCGKVIPKRTESGQFPYRVQVGDFILEILFWKVKGLEHPHICRECRPALLRELCNRVRVKAQMLKEVPWEKEEYEEISLSKEVN